MPFSKKFVKQDPARGREQQELGLAPEAVQEIMSGIYARGDRLMTLFILIHCGVALILAPFYKTWLVTFVTAGLATTLFLTSVKLMPRSFLTRCIAGISLQMFVALHIYQWHGLPEMHFFFFTAQTMMIAYQDWKSMWPGTLLIIAQHILFAALTNIAYLNGFQSGLYFFPETYIAVSKLVFHFGIGCVQVAICGYWAGSLRYRTLKNACQTQELAESRTLLEDQLHRVQQSEQALRQTQTELEFANQQLQALVSQDGLTGLKNHRAFQERLTQEFLNSARYSQVFSLIMVDVDNFKQYNDAYGHPAGDVVLKTVARLLVEWSRDTDMVARYGGEEFVLLLPHTEAEETFCLAERLRQAIAEAEWPESQITISLGIATWHPFLRGGSELVSEADQALYASKRDGRNRATHFAELRRRASRITGVPHLLEQQRAA